MYSLILFLSTSVNNIGNRIPKSSIFLIISSPQVISSVHKIPNTCRRKNKETARNNLSFLIKRIFSLRLSLRSHKMMIMNAIKFPAKTDNGKMKANKRKSCANTLSMLNELFTTI